MNTEVTVEQAKAQADMAMSQANIAMNNVSALSSRINVAELETKRAGQDASIARTQVFDLEKSMSQFLTIVEDQKFKIQQLEEGHHDLNMALSETNERLETMELMMSVQTTAPIAAATDAEAELVDQLLTAESQIETVNGQLDQALQLIYDIRKRARELGSMNTDEWMDLGQRSVAILELHKLI